MDLIYRNNYYITNNDVDCFGRLKPSSLLNFMQDAAISQCENTGWGGQALMEKGLIWVVTRQKVQIDHLPKAGSTITIETWPGITTRVAYPRSTVGYDENGNEVFRAIALWVLMDVESRAMVVPKKSGVEVMGLERGGELLAPGSLAPVKLEGHKQRQVMFSELDTNGHMSNTRYLDWMADLLPSAFHATHPIREFTVSYLSEARESELVDLNYELSPEGELRLEATQNSTGHRVFAVRAAYCG